MFGANLDGSDLRLVLGDGLVSHYDWRNDQEILAWTRIDGHGDHFYRVNERTGAHEIVGEELLTQDGHCSYSHNGRWILTDTYPHRETFERDLKIYIPDENRQVIVGRYLSPPPFTGEIRCDLHPRWSPDDTRICFDSVHEGERQIYVIDTPELS
jgi:Tol biopolymer transport system component